MTIFKTSEHEKTRKIRHSISKHFSYSLIVVVSIIMIIFSSVVIAYDNSTIEKQLDNQLVYISNMAQTGLVNLLWDLNVRSMNDFLNALYSDERIVFIQIIPLNIDVEVKKLYRIRPGFETSKDFSFFKTSSRFIVKEIDIEYNIDKENRKIGKFQIAMSRDMIKQQLMFHVASIIILMILIISVISITSIFITGRYIFMPLMKLTNAAKQIAEGNLDIPDYFRQRR